MGALRYCAVCLAGLGALAVPFTLSAETTWALKLNPPAEGLRDHLKAASGSRAARKSEDSLAVDLLAAAQADYRALIGALYDKGYFGPTVSIRVDGVEASSISPLDAPDTVGAIEINVKQGPRFTFGIASMSPQAPGTEVPEDFAPGKFAKTESIRDAAKAGVEAWRNAGHAKADVSGQSIKARHSAAELDARLTLDPGPRLRFGDLSVTGTSKVRPERIRAIAGLPKGEVFSPSEVEDATQRLRRAGAFRSANLIEADTPNPDGTLDFAADISDQKPRRFGFGAEYSTIEGFTVSGYWLHRNLMGGAERLRIDAEVRGIGGQTGGEDYTLELTFGRPATFRADTDFYVHATLESLDEPSYRSDLGEIEMGLTRRYSDALGFRVGLGLFYEQSEDAFGRRDNFLLTLPLGVRWDKRSDELNPLDGYFVEAEVKPFLGLDGAASGGRFDGDARFYYGLGADDRFVLAGRAQLGFVSGPGIDEAPADFLFYSGGGGTVRGQPYQSLGVTLPSGEEVGGRSFVGLSAELRAGVSENWSLVGFYDYGFVSEDPDWSNGDSHSGAGLGVRYNTGIGPVRFDVATPADGDRSGKDFEFYVGIGQAF